MQPHLQEVILLAVQETVECQVERVQKGQIATTAIVSYKKRKGEGGETYHDDVAENGAQ